MFITFEGIDGSGKSTQAKMLRDRLESEGVNVMLTREPKYLRNAIGSLKNKTGKAAVMTFMADRAIHVEELIKPALDEGWWVICDRWSDSTRVYQTVFKWEGYIKELSDWSSGYLVPDVTFLLNMTASHAQANLGGRLEQGDLSAFDKEDFSVHQQRADKYLELATVEERIKVIHGVAPIDKVHEDIYKCITTLR
jgi:dTMP kinase